MDNIRTTSGFPNVARKEAYERPLRFAKAYARPHLGAILSTKLSVRKLSRNRYFAWINGGVPSTRDGATLLAKELNVPAAMTPLLSNLLDGEQWTPMWVGASDDRGVITCKIYLSATQKSAIQSLEWVPGEAGFSTKVYETFEASSLPDLRYRARIALGLHGFPLIREIEVERCFERTFDILGTMNHLIDALVVREVGGRRTSLDFNIGRSDPITVERLDDEIGDIADILGIEEESYRTWLGAFGARSLSRIAIGLDATKHPFVTLYDSTPLPELNF